MSLDLILFAAGANAFGQAVGTYTANKITDYGQRVEQQQNQNRWKALEVQSTQDALQSAKQLREALSTNNAIYGMRGQMAGTGSALAVQNQNLNTYNNGKAIRDLNLNIAKNDLKIDSAISSLNATSKKSERRTQGFSNVLQSVPWNTLFTGKKDASGSTKWSFNGWGS